MDGQRRRKSIAPPESVASRRPSTHDKKRLSVVSRGAASGAASADGRRQKFVIWPEWSDTDINAEKWEVAHKGKEKEKGKSPVAQHFFDDPDGKVILPPSLAVSHWKRPQEFIADKAPVVVDPDRMFGFDLMASNDHVLHCETIRWIISQVSELWQLCASKATGNEAAEVPVAPDGTVFQWRPWEHIYAMTKVGKGPNVPQYNPYGKYAVKLFWMGCWRKLVVDDTIPFDDNDQCLLPCTSLAHELWPLLLTKALIKVASLDYGGGSGNTEFGDFSVIHCLTGWLPQTILVKKGNEDAVWRTLCNLLPEWKLPEPADKEPVADGEEKKEAQPGSTPDGEKGSEGKEAPQTAKDKGKEKKDDKGKDKGKDGSKDKKDKDKDKGKEKSVDEQVVYDKPEVVVFASYHDVNKKNPFSILSLAEMADRSERLRTQGLSHLLSHPVLLSRTRACPLTPPPPPEVVPAWKLVRPRVARPLPTSEAREAAPDPDKPPRCVEVRSALAHHHVAPPPSATSRPRSALQRGGTRPSTPPQPPLDEAEEAEPAVPEPAPAPAPAPAPVEEPEKEPEEDREAASAAESRRAGKKTSVASTRAKEDGGKTTATPSSGAPAAGAEEMGEEEAAEEPVQEETAKKTMWMDVDAFCECFQAIHVYHKVHTYSCTKSFTDMKVVPVDERQPHYLFVDSQKPSEVLFCMSALCRWNEAPTPPPQSAAGPKSGGGREKGDDASVVDQAPAEPRPAPVQEITPGSMISERHCWRAVTVGDLFKRLRTTGTRAVSLHLPAGRHCLKLFVHAPLGFHLTLAAAAPFVFGDEEAVLPQLTREPARLIEQGVDLGKKFGRLLTAFTDKDALKEAEREWAAAHCPAYPRAGPHRVRLLEHHAAVLEALYAVLRKMLPPDCVSADVRFALRALFFDNTTRNPLGPPPSRPDQSTLNVTGESDAAQPWSSREPTGDELVNVVKLQKCTRGGLVRKTQRAREGKDNEQHQRAVEALQRVWTALEANADQFGLALLKQLFRQAPHLLPHFALAPDMRNFVSYTDYSGAYAEQPAQQWFVVFRDVFTVPDGEQGCLMLPRLSCPVPTCCLRVIDNDSGEELERSLGERTPPHFYRRNRAGYTLLAVARSLSVALPAGRWRLRLIGDGGPALVPRGNDICSSFYVRELHDYFVPRDSGVLFRQAVRVADDHLITAHLALSRPDVPLRLTVLDAEREVAAVAGRGQLVLPAFLLRKDGADGDETRTSSRQSQRAQPPGDKGKKRASGSARSPSQRQMSTSFQFQPTSERQSSALSGGDGTSSSAQAHKYVIQATIDRAAWPLSPANWAFVHTLKQQEKEELKTDFVDNSHWEVFGKPRDPSPPKPAAAESKKDAGKGGKGGKAGAKGDKGKAGDKGKDSGSRPESVTFDMSKAHWTMRLVSDNNLADEIQVRRDTERAEQIRAMKKAWEDVEPGRAERARQSRLRFLNAHLVSPPAAPEDAPSVDADTATAVTDEASLAPEPPPPLDEALTLDPPGPPPAGPAEALLPIDRERYLEGDPNAAEFRDFDSCVAEETEAKRAALDAHRSFMEAWEARVAEDRRLRNRKKMQQIEDAYRIQAGVDAYREAYFRQREAFRQRLLAEERRKQEELAAAEAASPADPDAKPKSPKGKKGSARASAKKGKKK